MPFREVTQEEIDAHIKDLIAKHPEYQKEHDEFMERVDQKVSQISESKADEELKK